MTFCINFLRITVCYLNLFHYYDPGRKEGLGVSGLLNGGIPGDITEKHRMFIAEQVLSQYSVAYELLWGAMFFPKIMGMLAGEIVHDRRISAIEPPG